MLNLVRFKEFVINCISVVYLKRIVISERL